MRTKSKRLILLMMAGLFVLPSLLNVILPPPSAQAEDYGWGEGITAYDQARRWLFYRGMWACLEGHTGFSYGVNDAVSTSDIEDGTWMDNDGEEAFGFVARDLNFDQDGGDDQDGDVRCDDGSIWVRGATAFGFNSVVDLVCAMNRAQTKLNLPDKMIKPNGTGDDGNPDCESSTQFTFGLGGDGGDWQQSLTQALSDEGSGTRPKFDMNGDDAQILLYVIGRESLLTFCGKKGDTTPFKDRLGNNTNDDNRVQVDVVDEATGDIDKNRNYVIYGGRDQDSEMHDVMYLTDSLRNGIGDGGGNNNEGDDLKCYEMARMTQGRDGDSHDYSEAYAAYVKAHPNVEPENPGGGGGGSDPETEDTTTCAVDGIGWVICPVMTFIGDLNDRAYGFLSQTFLVFDVELLQDPSTKAAWENFRNIANVLFVILFLMIIYSQVSGGGFSNYSIKRMLPRIIIAAILVNISFYICQIAVDISNIIGNGIASFLGTSIPTTAGGEATTANTNLPLWKDVIGGALILGAAAIALALAFAIGLPGLLVLALIVLALVMRKAIILLLIVVSPLAFVAYLLPNTEDWFKKWWKLFYTMLMVYPVIGLLFGASALAAGIINAGSNGDALIQLTALGVSIIPLFAVPVVLKGAMAGLGSIGTRINGLTSKASGNATGNIKRGRSGEAIAAFQARRQERRVDRRLGEGRIASWGKARADKGKRGGEALQWIGSRGAAFDRSGPGRYLGGDRGAASAVYEQQKLNNEAVERSIAMLENNPAGAVIPEAKKQLAAANKKGDVVAARAAARVLASKTGSRGVDELHQALSAIEEGGGLHDNVVESVKHEVNAASLKGKDRSLDKWSRDEAKREVTNPDGSVTKTPISLTDYDTRSDTPGGLNEAELAGHSLNQLRRFGSTGAISVDHAQRVIDAHGKGTIHLDGDKLQVFTDIAGGKIVSPPRPPSP